MTLVIDGSQSRDGLPVLCQRCKRTFRKLNAAPVNVCARCRMDIAAGDLPGWESVIKVD